MQNTELKEKYDVIVIGAGPSGCTPGYLLSEKGLDVLIIDREEFPRQKLCAGLITWKTRNLLEKLFEIKFDAQFSIENISKDFYIYEKSEEKIFQTSPEPFYFVNRTIYDMELISMVNKKKCVFLFNSPVIDIDIHKNIVTTKSGKLFKGRIIIGADGVNSLVRRKICPRYPFKHNLSAAFQMDVPIDKVNPKYQSPSLKMFFGDVKHGYGWIFPHKEHFVVGMGGLIRKNRKLRNIYLSFLKNVVELNKEMELSLKSHLVPFGNFIEEPGFKNILLVGDAAGFVDPFTGEGIYYAHKSSELASKAISNFFESGAKIDLLKCYRTHLNPMYKELKRSVRLSHLAYSNLRHFFYHFKRGSKFYLKASKIIHGLK